MADSLKRDSRTGALLNNNVSGYNARKLAKERAALVNSQQTKIESLEAELTSLKARVLALESNSPS